MREGRTVLDASELEVPTQNGNGVVGDVSASKLQSRRNCDTGILLVKSCMGEILLQLQLLVHSSVVLHASIVLMLLRLSHESDLVREAESFPCPQEM